MQILRKICQALAAPRLGSLAGRKSEKGTLIDDHSPFPSVKLRRRIFFHPVSSRRRRRVYFWLPPEERSRYSLLSPRDRVSTKKKLKTSWKNIFFSPRFFSRISRFLCQIYNTDKATKKNRREKTKKKRNKCRRYIENSARRKKKLRKKASCKIVAKADGPFYQTLLSFARIKKFFLHINFLFFGVQCSSQKNFFSQSPSPL